MVRRIPERLSHPKDIAASYVARQGIMVSRFFLALLIPGLRLLLFRFESTMGLALVSVTSLRQRQTSSRQMARLLAAAASSSSGTSSSSDDVFMSSLRNRMDEISDTTSRLPLVVLDTMLPRQVLKIKVANPLFLELIRNLIERENPYFGMMGMAKLKTGEQVMMKSGVEVEFETKGIDPGSIQVELRARRRFRIDGDVRNAGGGWTEAKVTFLDSKQEEQEEINDKDDVLGLARAMQIAKEFTAPNVPLKNNQSLVDRWIELARKNERQPGQIDQLLQDLGEIPPADQPSERAFWVGALINPIPAMGVAMEIRPALLSATTAEKRVQIALDGIFASIKHMSGDARMW